MSATSTRKKRDSTDVPRRRTVLGKFNRLVENDLIRRVSYDHDEFLQRLERSGHPEVDYIASFQRGEQIRYAASRPGAPTVAATP